MLFQIHQQLRKTGETLFCLQDEIGDDDKKNKEILDAAIERAWEQFPPPPGWQFLLATEDSPYFSWACLNALAPLNSLKIE